MADRYNPRQIPLCIADPLGVGMMRDIELRFSMIGIELTAREWAVVRDAVMDLILDFCDVQYPEKTK